MRGGAGDDVYTVDDAGDVVTEIAGEGADEIRSSITRTPPPTSSALRLTGTANIDAYGTAGDDDLAGNAGRNLFYGDRGADRLTGGAGDDTYSSTTTGTRSSNWRTRASTRWRRRSRRRSRRTSRTCSSSRPRRRRRHRQRARQRDDGRRRCNVLTGLAGNDTLDGGAGADRLVGGAGNDTYVDRPGGRRARRARGRGARHRARAAVVRAARRPREPRAARYLGSSPRRAMPRRTSSPATRARTSSTARPAPTRWRGQRQRHLRRRLDRRHATELASEGTDLVQSSVSFVLGANVENLTLTGAAAINATGNTLANALTGNAAANTLDGGAGQRHAEGRHGRRHLRRRGDRRRDHRERVGRLRHGARVDLLDARRQPRAPDAHRHRRRSTAPATRWPTCSPATPANNVLDGKAGADAMAGGKGNDTYVVDSTGDVVTENASEGTDLVQSSVSLHARRRTSRTSR